MYIWFHDYIYDLVCQRSLDLDLDHIEFYYNDDIRRVNEDYLSPTDQVPGYLDIIEPCKMIF